MIRRDVAAPAGASPAGIRQYVNLDLMRLPMRVKKAACLIPATALQRSSSGTVARRRSDVGKQHRLARSVEVE